MAAAPSPPLASGARVRVVWGELFREDYPEDAGVYEGVLAPTPSNYED